MLRPSEVPNRKIVSNGISLINRLGFGTIAAGVLTACGPSHEELMKAEELKQAQARTAQMQAEAEQAKIEATRAAQNSPVTTFRQICQDNGIDPNNEVECKNYLASQNPEWKKMVDQHNQGVANGTVAQGTNFWDFMQTAAIVGGAAWVVSSLLNSFSPRYQDSYTRSATRYESRLRPEELARMRQAHAQGGMGAVLKSKEYATNVKTFQAPKTYNDVRTTFNGKTVDTKTTGIPQTRPPTPGAQIPGKDGKINPQTPGVYTQKQVMPPQQAGKPNFADGNYKTGTITIGGTPTKSAAPTTPTIIKKDPPKAASPAPASPKRDTTSGPTKTSGSSSGSSKNKK